MTQKQVNKDKVSAIYFTEYNWIKRSIALCLYSVISIPQATAKIIYKDNLPRYNVTHKNKNVYTKCEAWIQ